MRTDHATAAGAEPEIKCEEVRLAEGELYYTNFTKELIGDDVILACSTSTNVETQEIQSICQYQMFIEPTQDQGVDVYHGVIITCNKGSLAEWLERKVCSTIKDTTAKKISREGANLDIENPILATTALESLLKDIEHGKISYSNREGIVQFLGSVMHCMQHHFVGL